MENILEIKNLCKNYENFQLKNININLQKGMIMGLIGENGAGKSTIIKSILNLININEGEIKIFGLDYKNNEKEIKEEIGVVLDDGFLSEKLTPNDINQIMKEIYKNWEESLYFKYLERLKLPKEKILKEYSSGMKMKLKIVVALSHNPRFLILDEPTSCLDPVSRNDILDIFREFIQDENKGIFVSSHITSDLENIADYIVFISDGEIVLNRTRDELIDKMGIVRCTEDEFNKIDKKDYLKYRKRKYEYDVLIESKNEFKDKYDMKIIDRPSIEEIMIIYVKGEK